MLTTLWAKEEFKNFYSNFNNSREDCYRKCAELKQKEKEFFDKANVENIRRLNMARCLICDDRGVMGGGCSGCGKDPEQSSIAERWRNHWAEYKNNIDNDLEIRPDDLKRMQDAYWDDSTRVYDDVKKPQHYVGQGIEAKDYIKQILGSDGWVAYCMGAVMKYIHRHQYKGNAIQDLEKAHTYLGWAIEEMKQKE